MTYASIKKSSLRNYEIIPGPGTYIVKVANAVKPEYLIEDGSKSRYIVNLRCAPLPLLEECVSIMGPRELIPFEQVKHCFSSGTLWENEIEDLMKLPAKGEEIIATFEMKEQRLLCTALTLIPRKKLSTFNLDAYCTSRQLLKKLIP